MANLLTIPLELQLPIFELSENLRLKEVCQSIKTLFDENIYNMTDNILFTNVKKTKISQLSSDVMKKVADHQEILTDLVLRSIVPTEPIGRVQFMPFNVVWNTLYGHLGVRVRPWHIYHNSIKLDDHTYYRIIKTQHNYQLDKIQKDDIEKAFDKLIQSNDLTTIINIIKKYGEMVHHLDKQKIYKKLRLLCAFHNNFKLYQEIDQKPATFTDTVSFWGLKYHDYELLHFIKYQNIAAIEYIKQHLPATDILEHAVKLHTNIVFDRYIKSFRLE